MAKDPEAGKVVRDSRYGVIAILHQETKPPAAPAGEATGAAEAPAEDTAKEPAQ